METSLAYLTAGQIYLWEEILQSGLNVDRFVKNGNFIVNLENNIVCHEYTFFSGVTFIHYPNTNKFKVEENSYSEEKVERLIQIRDLEAEIEHLETSIWDCKLEFTNSQKLAELQNKLVVLKGKLIDLLNNRILKQCA